MKVALNDRPDIFVRDFSEAYVPTNVLHVMGKTLNASRDHLGTICNLPWSHLKHALAPAQRITWRTH